MSKPKWIEVTQKLLYLAKKLQLLFQKQLLTSFHHSLLLIPKICAAKDKLSRKMIARSKGKKRPKNLNLKRNLRRLRKVKKVKNHRLNSIDLHHCSYWRNSEKEAKATRILPHLFHDYESYISKIWDYIQMKYSGLPWKTVYIKI